MKKSYLIIALSILVVSLNAQYKWAHRGGLWAYDYGYGVVTDANSNTYVAGKFEIDQADFDGVKVSCAGNHDAFIAKYNVNGTIQWVKRSGGADGDYWWSMSTDKNNNLYVAGEIEGSSNYSFSNSTLTLNGAGDNDIILAKYDLNGNVIWAKREGVLTSEKALAVTNDVSGNVYICGYFTANTNFNGTAVTGYGAHDIFVAKYDGNGAFQWVKKAGGTGRDEARSIKHDGNGNLYVCGLFDGPATFDGINMTTQDAFHDAFLMKMSDSNGSIQWVKQGNATYDDVAWSVVLDNGGNIYTSGEFNSYLTWNQTAVAGLPTAGTTDMFVTKFDNTGNVLWMRAGGGTMRDIARGSGTDGTNIYFTGQFGGVANFGPYSVTAAVGDSSDIFISSIDASGNWRWAAEADGPKDTYESLGYESGIAICADAGNVIATGGMLMDTLGTDKTAADFSGIVLNGYSRTDMFVVAIANTGVGIVNNTALESIDIFPNPTTGNFTMDFSKVAGALNIKIYNTMGQLVQNATHAAEAEVQLDLGANKDGIYMMEVTNEENAVFRKKIILQH